MVKHIIFIKCLIYYLRELKRILGVVLVIFRVVCGYFGGGLGCFRGWGKRVVGWGGEADFAAKEPVDSGTTRSITN